MYLILRSARRARLEGRTTFMQYCSGMPEDRMRAIGLLQPLDVLAAQLDLEGRDGVVEMLHLAGADDRRRHAGPRQQPGERDLRRLAVVLARHFLHALGDREVVGLVVHLLGEVVGAGPHRAAALLTRAVAGEEAARQRAPGNEADALVEAERDH